MGNQRGGLTSKDNRMQILEWVEEAMIAGAKQETACKLLEVTPRTLQRWKKESGLEDKRAMKKWTPHNKLTEEEKEKILQVVNQPKYAYLSPSKIVPLLADQGKYLASESTMYRLLKKEGLLHHRSCSKPCRTYKPRAIVATQPNQVYSWDITYLTSSVKGMFFYLYLIMDVYSRKIVGWQVYDKESSEYAADVLENTCFEENIEKGQVILHSDNGSPMKGATMLATLQKLGVIPSFSRPAVSNDNPYSESLFKTLKYAPTYPRKPFTGLQEARSWVNGFVHWYNYEHLHSGIKFITPAERHEGRDNSILERRAEVYQRAKVLNPHRWSGKIRDWSKTQEVLLNPEKGKTMLNSSGAAA